MSLKPNITEQKRPNRNRQFFAISIGGLTGFSLLAFFNGPLLFWFHAPGDLNTGHENLRCVECHKESPGSLRQQIQSQVRNLLDEQAYAVSPGHLEPDNSTCNQCHDRKKDFHPVFRFLEPRFSKARKSIKPQFCHSCHQEHQGKRVSIDNGYCRECHEKLVLKKDPVKISHKQLIKEKKWGSCLGCHDFHGNHKMKIKKEFDARLSEETIKDYFDGGKSPYSDVKYFSVREVN